MFIVRQCVCVGYGVYKTITLKKFDNYQDAINYTDDVPNSHIINERRTNKILKIKEIEEQLKDLNEDARNWASMTPGGYSYITVNKKGVIDLDVHSVTDIFDYNYDYCYPMIAPATLDQVLKGLDHWGIKYE